MRAIVYTQYGSPDVLQLRGDVERPTPAGDELLIRVRAAEVTKSDCEMRSFKFPVSWFWLPLRLAMGVRKPKRPILGGYFAGDVVESGAAVTRFQPGDRVYGAAQLRLGAYGEYISLPASYSIVLMPDNLSFEEAAAVPLGGLNALHFMREARIHDGDKVLINGAGGSIGTFGVQIAKAMGAEVTAVDSGIKEDMLRKIGADHFVDYTREDFTDRGDTYDVIFNMVATSPYSSCIRTLNPKGRYLTANPRLSVMLRCMITSSFSDRRAVFSFARETQEELLALKSMIEEGKITPAIDRVYPLEQAAEAHRRVETEQRLGIVVLAVAQNG